MIQTSIFEQFDMFFKLFMNQTNKLIILLISALILVFLIFANKFHNKVFKIIFSLIYVSIIGYLIYMYYDEIFSLFDYFMDNLILLLFFPNLAVYIFIVVLVNVLIIRSTFSKEDKVIKKSINIIFFLLFNIIFYFIINNIITNQINVYEQLNIYTNSELLNLIELNMQLFLIWLLVLVILKVINYINKYLDKVKENKNILVENEITAKELKNANSFTKYNDYLDIMPVKKQNKFVFEINSELPKNDEIINIKPQELSKTIIEDIKPQELSENIIEEVKPRVAFEEPTLTRIKKTKVDVQDKFKDNEINNILTDIYDNSKTNSFEEPKIPTLDEVLKNNSCKKAIIEPSYATFKPIENEIDLSSYDNIFSNYQTPDEEFENNMDQVFSTNNNYLEKLLYDVENLRNNQDDKNSIQDIYFKIKTHQNELSLNDYNYLINRLLEIKNS